MIFVYKCIQVLREQTVPFESLKYDTKVIYAYIWVDIIPYDVIQEIRSLLQKIYFHLIIGCNVENLNWIMYKRLLRKKIENSLGWISFK